MGLGILNTIGFGIACFWNYDAAILSLILFFSLADNTNMQRLAVQTQDN